MKELAKKIKKKEDAVDKRNAKARAREGTVEEIDQELDEIRTESEMVDRTTTNNKDVLMNLDRTTARNVNFEFTRQKSGSQSQLMTRNASQSMMGLGVSKKIPQHLRTYLCRHRGHRESEDVYVQMSRIERRLNAA